MSGPGQPVLWIDPGKMTGLALWAPQVPGLPSYYRVPVVQIDEFDFMTAGNSIENTCRNGGSSLLVGWEHFVITPRTPPADAHHAIEMIGVARRLAIRWGCTLLPVAMPDARKTVTRPMLEAIGWWLPGKDDAQSAAQHLLAWMLRVNSVPDDVMIKIRGMI